MTNYKVSLEVVRRANERMGRRQYTGNVQNGQVVVNVNTGNVSKSVIITSGQIKDAYRKAIQTVNAKEV